MKWDKILTAPKNGERVLLWNKNWITSSTGFFMRGMWFLHSDLREFAIQPSHWMALPLGHNNREVMKG